MDELESLRERVAWLEARFAELESERDIFMKAFRVVGLHRNFVEFGCFRGNSLISACTQARKLFEELVGPRWSRARTDETQAVAQIRQNWESMRFFAFDSFEGIPETSGPDKQLEIFKEGNYACTEAEMRANLEANGFAMEKLVTVPGFFEESCTPETAERIGLRNVGIVHIDSDLYASAKTALEFITPYLPMTAIIIFDEWFQYFGHPHYGEQRAFREWQEAHPEFSVHEFQKSGATTVGFVVSRV